jgi:hypothetical protein
MVGYGASQWYLLMDGCGAPQCFSQMCWILFIMMVHKGVLSMHHDMSSQRSPGYGFRCYGHGSPALLADVLEMVHCSEINICWKCSSQWYSEV